MTEKDLFYEYHSGDFTKLSLSPIAVKELTELYGIENNLYVCGVYVYDNGEIELEKICSEKNFIDKGKLDINDIIYRNMIMSVARNERKTYA